MSSSSILRLQILSLMKDVERSKLDLLADTTIAKEIIRDWKQKQEKILQLKQQQSAVDASNEYSIPEDDNTDIIETEEDPQEE
jgi:hypothetical protein